MFNKKTLWLAGVLPCFFLGLAFNSSAAKLDERLNGETVKSAVPVSGPQIPEIGGVPAPDAAKTKPAVSSPDLKNIMPTTLGTTLPQGQASQAGRETQPALTLHTSTEQALTGVTNQMVLLPTAASRQLPAAHLSASAGRSDAQAVPGYRRMPAANQAAKTVAVSLPPVKAEQKLYVMSAEVKKTFDVAAIPEGKLKTYRENGIPVKLELQKTGGGMQVGEALQKYGETYLPNSLTDYDQNNKFVSTVQYTRDAAGTVLTSHQTNADGSTIDVNGDKKIYTATDGTKQEYHLEGENWVLFSNTDAAGRVTPAGEPVVGADGWATTYDPATGAPVNSTKDGVVLSDYIPDPRGGEGYFPTHQERTVDGGKEITDSTIDPATGIQTDNIQYPDGTKAKVNHKEGDPVQEVWITHADGSAGEHYKLNSETREKISIHPDGSETVAAKTDAATGIRTVNNPDGSVATYDKDGKPLTMTTDTAESTTVSKDYVPDTSDPGVAGAFTATTMEITYKTGEYAGQTHLVKITVNEQGKGVSYLRTDKTTGEEIEGGDL